MYKSKTYISFKYPTNNYKSSPTFYNNEELAFQTTIKTVIPQMTPVHEPPHPSHSYPPLTSWAA
jgi:hypothetical protein